MKQTIYTNEETAARAIKRNKLKHPLTTKLANGKVVVREHKGDPLHDASKRIKSVIEDPVKYVWDLCFKHPTMKRRDIVTKAIEAGVSVNTAKTQYQYWRKASGMVKHV